jgi:hypothetical protein
MFAKAKLTNTWKYQEQSKYGNKYAKKRTELMYQVFFWPM